MAAGKIGANAAPATTKTAKPGSGASPTANGKPEQTTKPADKGKLEQTGKSEPAGKPGRGKDTSPKDRANLSEEAREGEKPGAGRKGEKPGEGKELKGIRKDVEDLKKQLSEMEKPGEKGGAEQGGGESGGGGCQKGGGSNPAPQAGNCQEPGQGQGQPQDINAQLLSEAAQVLMQGQLGGGQPQPGAPQAAGCGQKPGQVEGGDARANLGRKYLQAVANPQTGQQIKPETHMLVQAALGIGGGQPAGNPAAAQQSPNPFQNGPGQKVPGLGTGMSAMALAVA